MKKKLKLNRETLYFMSYGQQRHGKREAGSCCPNCKSNCGC